MKGIFYNSQCSLSILACSVILMLIAHDLFAQGRSVTIYEAKQAVDMPVGYKGSLNKFFTSFHIYELDHQILYQQVHGTDKAEFILNLDDNHQWQITIEPNEIRSDDYVLAVESEKGIEYLPGGPLTTYKGFTDNNRFNEVRMSVSEHFVSALIKDGNDYYQLAPLSEYIDGAADTRYILYKRDDIIGEAFQCGTSLRSLFSEAGAISAGNIGKGNASCLEADIALVSRADLTSNKGGAQGVETFMLGYMNQIQSFYEQLGITHVVQGTYASTNSNLFNGTNVDQVHGAFVQWGQAGNLNHIQHDIGVLFSPNVLGNVAGRAYLGSVCSQNKYMWTSEQGGPGTLAHELGHGWGAYHDNDAQNGTGNSCPELDCVMRASATSKPMIRWSDATRNQILNFVDQIKSVCLQDCGSGAAPSPQFLTDASQGCETLTIEFVDTTWEKVDSRLWDFGDGTTSAEKHPVHTYTGPGTYTVRLTASNQYGENFIEDTIVVGNGNKYLLQNIGPADNNTGTGGGYKDPGVWMGFDALDNLVIEAITVYAESAGTYEFAIGDQNGQSLYALKRVPLTAGKHRVELNFAAPKGKHALWFLNSTGGGKLWRETDGINGYPYQIAELISVNTNYWMKAENYDGSKGWYVGYNWEVRKGGCDQISAVNEMQPAEIEIYPNPGQGLYNIELPAAKMASKITINVYNIYGQIIQIKETASPHQQLDLTEFSQGTYFVDINTGDYQVRRKVVKF